MTPALLPTVALTPGQEYGAGQTVRVSAPQTWTITPVDWHDPRAAALRDAMDAEIGPRYADRFEARAAAGIQDDPADFAIDPATLLVTVLVHDADGTPVGHAALRRLGDEVEVKRVYIGPAVRGAGASRALMSELERLGRDAGAVRLILQTRDRQPEAIALYEHIGYTPIPIFAPYTAYEFSRCYEKRLV